MSQTIKPVKWLEAALWLLGVWDIFETTSNEVMNDEGGELWMCSLAFDIPIRYNNEVRHNIVQTGRQSRPRQAPRSMPCCFLCRQLRMSDFSSLKIEALRQHSLDMPSVSERHATFNHMDVVRHDIV